MRNIWIILVTGLFLTACSGSPKTDGSAGEAGAQEATAPQQWVEVTLEVEGMTCEGCENAINAGVESLEGVSSSQSSHVEKWTRVKYDPEVTSLDEVKEKITATGYQVTGVKEETTP